MNYTELRQAIQDYLQTTETSFVDNLDMFIRLAEERIFRSVYVLELRKTQQQGVVGAPSGVQTISKPADHLATYSLAYLLSDSSRSLLIPKDSSFIREAFPDPAVIGTPIYYANIDNSEWLLGPTAPQTCTFEITYYYMPESIVTASTSYLGDNLENVLLYACLVEAYTYLKGDPDLLQAYTERYQDALTNAAELGIIRQKRDDYRNGEI